MGALWARAAGRSALNFADFMDVVLYDPGAGYYRRERARIGYGPDTDFFTATTSAPLFGKLVISACTRLLSPDGPSDFDFVEVGAERGTGIMGGLAHPFRSARLVGIGEPLGIEAPSVVFSNELFDAQPFRRFRFRAGAWREMGVSLAEGALSPVELPPGDPLLPELPPSAPEDYAIDAPLASADLARDLAKGAWPGLFLAFDYGKSWEEIACATPAGTARAYRNHAQGNDLLANPGEQDLTCHVCWDWLCRALRTEGFSEPKVESQEAFFVHHAADFIAGLAAAQAGRLSREKLSLMQLIHPSHMGQKFQALWARRPGPRV